jgi:hypothetical protein
MCPVRSVTYVSGRSLAPFTLVPIRFSIRERKKAEHLIA